MDCGTVCWQAVLFLLQPMLAGVTRCCQVVTRCCHVVTRRCLHLAPPFLVEDYEPAAVATARTEGAMAAKLDQGTNEGLSSIGMAI